MTDPEEVIVGKMGKLPAEYDSRVKLFSDIAREFKLTPPPYWRVQWSRKLDVPALGTLLNDKLGDCTCASKGHDIQLWTAWTGTQAVIPDSECLKMYEAISGYRPGNPSSDRGATILSALQYWYAHGIAGHKLDGYASVSPGNVDAARTAIWLFGNLDIGLMLPLTCLNQAIWRLVSKTGSGAPGSAGGHDVNIVDYDDHEKLFTVITWGHLKKMSYSFFSYYCDECFALASKEWLLATNQQTPSDINWTTLLAYLRSGL